MKNKSILLFVLFLIGLISVKATIISGFDTSYADTEIIFLKSSDPFTGKEVELGRAVFDSLGAFNLNIEIQETTYLYAYLGKYKAFLFVEPDKEYRIVLPTRIDKGQVDNLNPFFEYSIIHLGILESDDEELNMGIRMFDDSFQPFYNKHKIKVFANDVEFEQLNKDIAQLDRPFSKSQNEYFNNYRKYKYGLLRFVAYQHKSKNVSDIYFKNNAFLANNPAFVDLFNLVYDNYFSYFTRTEAGKKLSPAINAKSYTQVKSVLANDEVLKPEELLNMVMLKSFYKEFYDDNFSRSAMLAIVDSLIEVSGNPLEISTAQSMREKVTKLLTGFAPPDFELYDMDSNLISLDNFKGKFVYLNFCSCFSYTCLNEFVMLQNIYNKHNKYLEIVTIVIDDDVEVLKDFLNRSGYSWTFLHFDNNPDILQKYDVRVFPTYYLIDNEGKLSMSPAAAPAEEFEGRLFKALRAKGIL